MFALHGLRVPDHSVITAPIRACIQDGNYERAEAEAILPLLRPDDRVLDLGGGIGVTAALCSKRLGAGRVVVVECHGKAARKAVESWLSPQGFTRNPGPDPRRNRVRIYERPLTAERKSNAEHV